MGIETESASEQQLTRAEGGRAESTLEKARREGQEHERKQARERARTRRRRNRAATSAHWWFTTGIGVQGQNYNGAGGENYHPGNATGIDGGLGWHPNGEGYGYLSPDNPSARQHLGLRDARYRAMVRRYAEIGERIAALDRDHQATLSLAFGPARIDAPTWLRDVFALRTVKLVVVEHGKTVFRNDDHGDPTTEPLTIDMTTASAIELVLEGSVAPRSLNRSDRLKWLAEEARKRHASTSRQRMIERAMAEATARVNASLDAYAEVAEPAGEEPMPDAGEVERQQLLQRLRTLAEARRAARARPELREAANVVDALSKAAS